MNRVAIVIGTAFTFAVLGMVGGHLCVTSFSTTTVIDAGGHAIRTSNHEELRAPFVIGCYLAAPVFAALLGFVVSVVALSLFGRKSPD